MRILRWEGSGQREQVERAQSQGGNIFAVENQQRSSMAEERKMKGKEESVDKSFKILNSGEIHLGFAGDCQDFGFSFQFTIWPQSFLGSNFPSLCSILVWVQKHRLQHAVFFADLNGDTFQSKSPRSHLHHSCLECCRYPSYWKSLMVPPGTQSEGRKSSGFPTSPRENTWTEGPGSKKLPRGL